MPDRLASDSDSAFSEAFERHWTSVFRFALAWTNNWAAAEDMAQEAFARMWASRERIDWSDPMLPWLLTTTRHLATDRFRALRRVFQLGGAGTTAALDSDARLQWLDVQAALSSLTPGERSSLILTAVVGLDSTSAAEVLGTTAGAVRASVSRARLRLAEQ